MSGESKKDTRKFTGTISLDSGQGDTLNVNFKEVEDFPWSVTREGEVITFKLGEGKDEKSEPHQTTKVRAFLIKNFNWNGIVNMMHLLAEKSDRLETYTRPTNLKGIPADDDILIIPDEAIEAIIYEQAKYAIETKYADDPDGKIDNILKYVDGEPKKLFAENSLGTTYDDLLKEADNTDMEYNGTSFTMPNLQTVSDADLYDFLKNLMLARNGLWLEDDGLMNLISIRRETTTSTTKDVGFNDSMLLAWKDSGVKKTKQYIATTEPTYLNKKNGKMLPQTTTMFLGMHGFVKSKITIPAFRSISNYRKKPNSNENVLETKDKGLDIHFKLVSNKKPVGIPQFHTAYGVEYNKDNKNTYSGKEREVYLTIIKIYKILSAWGAGNKQTSISCYKNLENYTKEFTLSDIIGTTDADKKIDIKIGDKVEDNVKLSTYRAYIDANYATKTKKDKALKLLMYYNTEANNGIQKSSYKDTSIADIVTDLKKEEVFKSIVQLQFNEEKNIKNIDGKPGTGTIAKAERNAIKKAEDTKTYNDKIDKANTDWADITEAFALWDTNSKFKDTLKTIFQDNLKMVDNDLKGLSTSTIDDFGGQEIKGNVAGWSTGCQVIQGAQEFFNFMYDITEHVDATSQERWYYTIVESSSLGITLN